MFKLFSGHSFPSQADPLDTLTAQTDAARAALVEALRACDHAVRRGDETALVAWQRDAAERQMALQTLSQRWLEQAARRRLWTVTTGVSSADLIESLARAHP